MDRQPADPDFPETSVPLDGTGFGAGGLTPSGRFSAEVGDGRRPSWQRYGGNARVIPGKNEQTGEEVAIKLVAKVHPYHRHRNDIVAANRVAEVRREAEIGCAVPPHPNVIRYYAAEENEFWFFLIMEMGVVELFDLVTDGGAQTQYEESTRVAAQLVEGLAHLHAHGVVHLDLKLDNCVRGRDDQWKWVDLGAASQGRMQRKVTGTGFYMAPELGRTGHEMDPAYDGFAVDCFALGVSLYLLLAGTFPFMPHDEQGTLAQPTRPADPLRARGAAPRPLDVPRAPPPARQGVWVAAPPAARRRRPPLAPGRPHRAEPGARDPTPRPRHHRAPPLHLRHPAAPVARPRRRRGRRRRGRRRRAARRARPQALPRRGAAAPAALDRVSRAGPDRSDGEIQFLFVMCDTARGTAWGAALETAGAG